VHVDGNVDPIRDIETIDTELLLADLETVQSSLDRLKKQATHNKELQPTVDVLSALQRRAEDRQAGPRARHQRPRAGEDLEGLRPDHGQEGPLHRQRRRVRPAGQG
jgi:ribosome-binding ATPase YchF (GTP1/OBG family)